MKLAQIDYLLHHYLPFKVWKIYLDIIFKYWRNAFERSEKRGEKLPMPERDCFLCFEFTFKEFTEEQVKICAEHWLDAENCPNWRPVDVKVNNKKIIWVESR